MIKIPHPVVSKTLLTTIGGGLVTAAMYLPMPWAVIVGTIGGLMGGKALLPRPGDVKAGS